MWVEDRQRPNWSHDEWDDPDNTDAIVVERVRRTTRPIKWLVYFLAFAVVVGMLVAGGFGLWYVRQVNPPGDAGPLQNFTVNADDTLETISARLLEDGIITNPGVFEWYVKRQGGLEITPGYYQLRPSDHFGNLLRVLRTPPALTYSKITFPEGFTIERMAERTQRDIPRLSQADFIEAATNGEIRSAYLPEGVDTLEGLLFPDTFQVSNEESAAQLVERMVALMERVGRQEDLEAGAAKLGLTPYQVLVVASMIEREAKVDDDRAKIARVIYNRMFFGIPLQIDATLYYQQDPDLPFLELKAKDTPYNTYLYGGLPPTPIANPGRASIAAALNPAPNPGSGDPICTSLPSGTPCVYLFYVVADEEGRHAFSATLEQHEANIERAREAGVL